VRIVASPDAIELASERGGRLYVWTRARRCCHGAQTWLEVAHERPRGTDFERVAEGEVEVYFPAALGRRPDELHLEVHGLRRKRVEAYWDGCAWVT
jgi:hypothetical protein